VTPEQKCRIAVDFHARGNLAEAERLYAEILGHEPNNFLTRHMLGLVRYQQGRIPEALNLIGSALKLNPHDAAALSNYGLVLEAMGRFEEALAFYGKAIAENPGFAEAYSNRGDTLQALERFPEAVASYGQAIERKPDHAEAWNNRGSALLRLGRLNEALADYGKATALRPRFADAWCNRGKALHALGRFDEALAAFDKAIEQRPDYADARLNKSLVELLLGKFDSGWRNYEGRKETFVPPAKGKFPPLLTSRADAPGKTILVHGEQGLGDTIQFFRYVGMLRDAGARVLFAPQKQLIRLLRSAGDGYELVDLDERSLSFDHHVPLMSLPLLFGTVLENIPAKVPYLFAEDGPVQKWRDRLGGHGFKIGICWKGKSTYPHDASRSLALAHFEKLSRLPHVRLISLHKGEGEGELNALPDRMIVERLGDDFDADAFVDTAAVMKCLDLVVTSDTSIPHLAGALGVPVWVALSHVPDWRWLLDRADSPWYPTMRLFRQPARGDWTSVFSGIATELARII